MQNDLSVRCLFLTESDDSMELFLNYRPDPVPEPGGMMLLGILAITLWRVDFQKMSQLAVKSNFKCDMMYVPHSSHATKKGVSFMNFLLTRSFRLCSLIAMIAMCVFLTPRGAAADSFDWRSAGGHNWNTTIKSQFGGTCWDFSACGTHEAKYKMTRNDPYFDPDVSEQQIGWETNPDMGSTGGGWGLRLGLFHVSWRGLGDRMPLSILQSRRRHRPLLAFGHGLGKPRLEERLQSERFHERHQHDEVLPEDQARWKSAFGPATICTLRWRT